MIIDRIIELAGLRAEEGGLSVGNIVIGDRYVAAELSDGNTGLAFRFPGEDAAGINACTVPLEELVGWAADSRSLLRSSIGLACCNALAPVKQLQPPETINSADAADIRDGDIVGMVGFFPPLVRKFEKQNIELRVFERSVRESHPCLYPDWAEHRLLPDCDVVIITGTSCINKTIDQLLSWCAGARQVMVTGPSTPMFPKAFEGTNAGVLAGARCREAGESALLQAVSRGSGGPGLLKYLEKITWRLKY